LPFQAKNPATLKTTALNYRMKVKILTPKENIFNQEAEQAILPGEDGEFSVFDFHQPCLCSLHRGQIRIKCKNKKEYVRFFIKRGLARATGMELIIIVVPYFADT
jgi:F0F1-type ATP synthase epsilon subunit